MTGLALTLAALLAADAVAPEPGEEALPPAPLISALSTSAAPGAADVPLRRDGESKVDPAARFRVVAGAPLSDARLVLFDAQEALVPAEEQAEIGSDSTRYTLAPARPLRPGARYTLRLEGAAGRELHDLAGHRFRPLSFALATTGDPTADRPAKKKGKRKTR